MNRRERQRLDDQTARLNALNVQLVVAGYVGTLASIANSLELGELDPGNHKRAEFIADIRRMQDRVALDMPEALTHLGEVFGDPVKVSHVLAEQEG